MANPLFPSPELNNITIDGTATFPGQTGYAFVNVSGVMTFVSSVTVPTPTPTTLGGVFSSTAPTHQFANEVDTFGNMLYAQAAFTDLSGSLGSGQFPALTGDVTSSGFATTIATVNTSPGSYGSSSSIPVFTVNGKGQITAITTASAAGGGNVSNSGTPTVNQFGVWVTSTTLAGVSITGLVKGNGVSPPGAATAGNDYLAPPSGTAIVKANSGGALANAVAGTDYQAVISATGVLKGAGSGSVSAATAGTDYVAPVTATTFTATQTFNGSTTALAEVLVNAAETSTVSATAATGTINFDVTTQSMLYYTTSASANWTLNVRGNSGNTLNSLMATGQTLTIVFLVSQGVSPFFESAFTIDGGAITPKWQGGTAPAAGNASGIDAYTYAIIKTGSAAFTVLASQTQFK